MSQKNNLVEATLSNELLPNKIIFKKYKIIRKIGESSFYHIYLVMNEKTNEMYKMKAEKKESQLKMIEQEGYFLYLVKGEGIPELITLGKISNYYILIEEYLQKSIMDLFIENNFKFSIKDLCLIIIQMSVAFQILIKIKN